MYTYEETMATLTALGHAHEDVVNVLRTATSVKDAVEKLRILQSTRQEEYPDPSDG